MFPADMSRALVSLLFTVTIQVGCAVQPTEQSEGDNIVEPVVYHTVEQWLDLQQEVDSMNTSEVKDRLAEVDRSAGTGQLFYYGVLNQQLPTYGAWTVARDTFQTLQENEELPKQLRQLAGILRQYNQSRINGYVRQLELGNDRAQLESDLNHAEDEKRQLQSKIQALTELEAAISTRKEE